MGVPLLNTAFMAIEGSKMGEASEPVGSVEVALAHATRLLESNPVLAAEQASEILKAVPAHPLATLLLGVARRIGGDAAAASDVLGALVATHPQWALAQYELALALSGMERNAAAIARVMRRAPTLPMRKTSERRPRTSACSPLPPHCAKTISRKRKACCAHI
jgi:hypothetical protein